MKRRPDHAPAAATPLRRSSRRWRGFLFTGLVFALSFLFLHHRTLGTQDAAPPFAWIGPLYVWIGVLPWLAMWWAGAWGFGVASRGLLGPRRGSAALQLALGGGLLMLLTWLVALVTLHPAAMLALPIAGVSLGVGARRHRWLPALRSDSPLSPPNVPRYADVLLMACAAPAAAYAVAVTLPAGTLWSTEAFGYDVLSYHLNLPRQWVAAGAMIETQHDVYGYLPSLIEVTFAWFFALRGATPEAVYFTQAFHATWAMLAAAIMAGFVWRNGRSVAAAALCPAVLLAVPWVLITSTLAYNEAVVLALSAAAAWLALDRPRVGSRWHTGVAIGLLVGAATMAKLTAGFMVAVPIGLILLARRQIGSACVAGLVGALVLVPYLVRNALWTGNPVFPFATDLLGMGHWTPALAERWNAGHGLAEEAHFSFDTLQRQWLQNLGYGTLLGTPTPAETNNVARFPLEYGLPVLWIGVAIATAMAVWPTWETGKRARLHRRRTRWLALALLGWIGWQGFAWFVLTHQQSRFLVVTVVPGVMLLGVGLSSLRRGRIEPAGRREAYRLILPLLMLGLMTATSYGLLFSQTVRGVAVDTGERVPMPVWFLSDAFATRDHPFHPSSHPINRLPGDATVLLVADTSRLFYLQPNLVYASAFDASPLGPVLDEAQGDADRAGTLVRDLGVTHLWVGWSELRRLHGTYGHDERVTEAAVAALVRDWPVVEDLGGSTLFAVPGR